MFMVHLGLGGTERFSGRRQHVYVGLWISILKVTTLTNDMIIKGASVKIPGSWGRRLIDRSCIYFRYGSSDVRH